MSNPSGSALAYVGPLVEAQRAWSALRGNGVEAFLLNESQGILYELGSVQVAVRAEQLEEAREVLLALGLMVPAPAADPRR